MKHQLQRYYTVTAHEILDALRSKRALIFLVLYLVGAITASIIFINVLHRVEIEAVKAMGLTPSEVPGRTTEILWKSKNFRNMMHGLIDDRDLMDSLLEIPPIALFYGWLSFAFTPLLVVLLSSSRIAEEVDSGAVKYALFRTGRATWCLGKFTGQALLLLAALLMSGLGAWLAGAFRLSSFEWGAGAVSMLAFSFKAWIYACCYLGLALGISQGIRSPLKATALALMGMIGFTILQGLYHFYHSTYRVFDVVFDLIPQGHRTGLWYPAWSTQLPAAVMLVALSLGYLLVGHLFFSRKDL